MPRSAGDMGSLPLRALARNAILATAEVTFGASGAVSSTVVDPGVSITKPAGTGIYRVSYPNCNKARGWAILFNAATAKRSFFEARAVDSAPSGGVDGTMDFELLQETAGTLAAANATSGDKAWFFLVLYPTNVT